MNLPNKITLSRILMIPVFMVFLIPLPENFLSSGFITDNMRFLISFNDFILSYGKYVGAAIFIIAAVTDKIDGYIARKYNLITRLGKFLDPIADKLLITGALIALVQRGIIGSWAAMIIISREFIVTGIRLIAAGEGVVIAAGNLGKIKMVTQSVAIGACLLESFPVSLWTDFPVHNVLLFIAVIFTVWSGIDYIVKNSDFLKKNN